MAANQKELWSIALDDGTTDTRSGFVFRHNGQRLYGVCRVINEFGEETGRWQVDHMPSGKRVIPNTSPALASVSLGYNTARQLASRLASDPAWQFTAPPQTPNEKAKLKSSFLDHLQALSII